MRAALTARRARLEAVFAVSPLTPSQGFVVKTADRYRNKTARKASSVWRAVADDAKALHARAVKEGEGPSPKMRRRLYSGRARPRGAKIKMSREQESSSAGDRAAPDAAYFGRCYWASRRTDAKYVGHTGTGFDKKEARARPRQR